MSKEQDIQVFSDFALNKQLLTAVAEAGYETPTPVQQRTIPLVLAGHDVLGIAQTGTGKTAAYLLPLLMKLKYPQGDTPRCLILTPTRELAMQVGAHFEQLATYTGLRKVVVYGGVGIKSQIEAIQDGTDVIIGTPGRVMDIYLKGELVVKELKMLVLDEADKIMDMGFMPQIRRMLEILPRKRQNLLFSATFPPIVERLSQEFLEFPEKVEITPQATPAEMVEQWVYDVPNFQTKLNLMAFLMQDTEKFSRVMVFSRTRRNADQILKFCQQRIEGASKVIHANKGQNTRINAMNEFKEGQLRMLIATDVASRGIDVSEVSHVFNFDVPLIYEDYVHRVGRTGRANREGTAFTFVDPSEKYHLKKIQRTIRMTIPKAEIPAGVTIEETSPQERKNQLRALDAQRRKEDPTFQGAFHDRKPKAEKAKERKRKPGDRLMAARKKAAQKNKSAKSRKS